jgi:Domain of unknown function (DUF2760)
MRIFAAFGAFFAVLFGRRPATEAPKELPAPEPTPIVPTVDTAALERRAEVRGALQLLSLLQREGRLVDFLAEAIDSYSDAQIGAAARDVHRGLRRALGDALPTEPVMAEREDSKVRVDPGFDPRRIRLTGHVIGEPPYTGTLKHHGWRVREVKLPELVRGDHELDLTVVAPAEVELSA